MPGTEIGQFAPTARDHPASEFLGQHAIGMAFVRLDKRKEAIEHLRAAIALNPTSAETIGLIGALLRREGKMQEAEQHLRAAISIKPKLINAIVELGYTLRATGKNDEAARMALQADKMHGPRDDHLLGTLLFHCGFHDRAKRHLDRYLSQYPDDPHGVRLLLAEAGIGPTPDVPPPDFLKGLYAGRIASQWKEPAIPGKMVAAAFEQMVSTTAPLDVVDLGCGSGAVGQLIRRPHIRHLDGIDISPEMLAKAKLKSVYNGLYQDDLVGFLVKTHQSYDVAVSAAALIHLGDLQPTIMAVAGRLKQNGLLIFTVFASDDSSADFVIHPVKKLAHGGCYAHRAGYIADLAEKTDLVLERIMRQVHEDHDGRPIHGFLVVLRKRGAPTAC
jgi:predicted TPR repeat methyltransferase